ncbi:MAG: histidine kinase [Chitinophagaceae bacterium]
MKSGELLIRYKLYHVLFWLLLGFGWYYFRYQDFSTTTVAIKMIFVKVSDLAILVYLTNYILIPQLLYKKRYILFGILYLILVVGFSVLKMYIEGQIMQRPDLFNLNSNLKVRVYDNVIPHFLLVSTGAAFKIMMDYARAQRRLGELAKANAETELNFLKSQINPHFLFNSLNSVYFLIDKTNSEARNALHQFSEMLRYQLYECNGDRIPVEKEIKYLSDYIQLQKLRNTENTIVEFNYSPQVKGFTIEPLLLLPFVENSFKHISHFNNGRPNKILVTANKSVDRFYFTSVNTKEGKRNHSIDKNGGIGLVNVKRRLELLYPGRYSLSVDETDDEYRVELILSIES